MQLLLGFKGLNYSQIDYNNPIFNALNKCFK
jgi:hypothetical protein